MVFNPVPGAEARVGAVMVDVNDRHGARERLNGFRQAVE